SVGLLRRRIGASLDHHRPTVGQHGPAGPADEAAGKGQFTHRPGERGGPVGDRRDAATGAARARTFAARRLAADSNRPDRFGSAEWRPSDLLAFIWPDPVRSTVHRPR